MSSTKRDTNTNLATAGLAAAAVLVFGATAAFAATSTGSASKGTRTSDQFSHNGVTYGDQSGRGSSSSSGGSTGVTGSSGAAKIGQGPHGVQSVKQADGQWVDDVWQTGKVDSISGQALEVTDDAGTTWQWTVDAAAKVRDSGKTAQFDSIKAGDTVTLSGTLSGTGSDSVRDAALVIDPGFVHGQD